MNEIFEEIKLERSKQNQKWGEQNHSVIEWIAILTEEVGEAAKEAVDYHFENGLHDLKKQGDRPIMIKTLKDDNLIRYRKELIQVAAVTVQMIECLDREAGDSLSVKDDFKRI